MSDHALIVATLAVSAIGVLLAGLDRWDRNRYRDFLVRVHKEAGDVQKVATYGSSVYPVTVEEEDLDLAFKAMAEDILLFHDGVWQCRPGLVMVRGSQEQADWLKRLSGGR